MARCEEEDPEALGILRSLSISRPRSGACVREAAAMSMSFDLSCGESATSFGLSYRWSHTASRMPPTSE
jgi:hypothetical protein